MHMAYSAMSASESFSTRFPLKLWRLLNRCSSGAICWSEHGRSIKIDRRRFEREYLIPAESAFKTSNFSSFVRQLNLYGFRKVINTFRFNQTTDAMVECDIHEYHHPYFRRGHPDLLNRVQRRMKGRKGFDAKHEMELENSHLSLLKPINQSTPKFEHMRFDRPPLQIMDMNKSLLAQTGFQSNHPVFSAVPWGVGQSHCKPISHPTLISPMGLQQIVGTSSLSGYNPSQAVSVSGYAESSLISNKPKYTVNLANHSIPQVAGQHGLPMVEAIQQVLGEKALSEIVLSPAVTSLTRSANLPPNFLPILNSMCSVSSAVSNTANTLQSSTITSESFLNHALSGQSAFSYKSVVQPQGQVMFTPSHAVENNATVPAFCPPPIIPLQPETSNDDQHSNMNVQAEASFPEVNDIRSTIQPKQESSDFNEDTETTYPQIINICSQVKEEYDTDSQRGVSICESPNGNPIPENSEINVTGAENNLLLQAPPTTVNPEFEADHCQAMNNPNFESQRENESEIRISTEYGRGASNLDESAVEPAHQAIVCETNIQNSDLSTIDNATSFLKHLSNGGFVKSSDFDESGYCSVIAGPLEEPYLENAS